MGGGGRRVNEKEGAQTSGPRNMATAAAPRSLFDAPRNVCAIRDMCRRII